MDGNDTLIGLDGADILDGGTGADWLIGGLDDDIYGVDDPGDLVWENQKEGQDVVQASISYALPDNVENLELTGTDNINATGNGLKNTLSGNAGNNVLDGRGGSDKLFGGAGNDTYLVNGLDAVTELGNQGEDTVLYSSNYGSYTLGDNVENLTLGAGAIKGTGNNLNNILTGNEQDNTLDGRSGEDTMIGGLGNDTYVVDKLGDVVTENANEGVDKINASISYTLPANVENIQLTGGGNIDATGNDLDNQLTGSAGLNVLAGGKGNDWYTLSDSRHQDIVQEDPGEGVDTVGLTQGNAYANNYTLPDNVENLVLDGGVYNGKGTGNDLNNQLIGNYSNNTLDGKGGADLMVGGGGNDTYIVDNSFDTVVEKAGQGSKDTIQSSVSYSLLSAPNVENLTLTGGDNVNITGNDLGNTLVGNSGQNVLTGNGGKDNFVFSTALGNADTISDFTIGVDRLSLAKSVFTGLGSKAGHFVANDVRFYAAPGAIAAHDADDRIVYDTTSGNLYYDADGNGAGSAFQYATLGGLPNLTATDLWVV